MINVIKRDSSVVAFDVNRIINAIIKAMNEVGVPDSGWAVNTALEIQTSLFAAKEDVTVKDIHHYVEEILMKEHPTVARAYIDHRARRDKAREEGSSLHEQIMGLINRTNSEILDENANKDSRVLHTQRDLLAGIISKHYGVKHILPQHIAKAHTDGVIHFHDLDYSPFFPITNCCLVDLDFMFKNGFKMGAADIETPKSITTAAALTAQVIAQVASSQYGGTTIGDIDLVLEPYVVMTCDKHVKDAMDWGVDDVASYAEAMTKRDVNSAMQGLLYEVNTLHTSNGQSPFVTFGFGMGTSSAARWVQQGILNNQITGLGAKGITPVFPKLVFAIKDGVNLKPEDVNYDIKQLALKCASERMYPDILSYEKNLEVTGSDKITYPMGCRSFLSGWVNPETGEYQTNGRNNLGVVSLNLPRIAIESDGDFDAFWRLLDERLLLCREALEARIKSLDGVKASVAPILYMEGAFGVKMKADDEISELFKNGRASISLGYIGLHEMMNRMFSGDTHPFDNPMAQGFAEAVVKKMRDTTDAWKKETGYGYGLYSTPSESLCDRFCRIDTNTFGVLAGVTDKGYYTNSFHLDVLKKVTPFQKIDFESRYPMLASGGHICYAEYPDMKPNLEGLEACWDYAVTRVPYIGTNTPVDECFECEFDGEFTATKDGYQCPKCGCKDQDKISVTRRTCGYLGNVGSIPYNPGKQAEVINRVKHC